MGYNPLSALDKTILTQYRKVRKLWEQNTNHSVYILTIPLNLSGFFATDLSHYIGSYAPVHVGVVIPFVLDAMVNFLGLGGYYNSIDSISSERVMERPPLRRVNRIFRLPMFLLGSGLSSFGIYQLTSGVINSDLLYTNFIGYLTEGLGILGLASSTYLKDADPRLLQAQPSKLKAKIKELVGRIKDLAPKPLPSPKPAFESRLVEELYLI